MRLVGVLALLAACGGDGPTCADAITRLATRVGNTDSPAITMMIGRCEQRKWSADIRRCIGDAATASDAVNCVKPVLEDGAHEAEAAKKELGPPPTPSDATQAQAASAKPRVIAFYPAGSPLIETVKGYFQKLGVQPEFRDRLVEAELAMKYKVVKDGTIVLERGDRVQTIELSPEPAKARFQLRRFDREVSNALVKLLRVKRAVYLTTGHGEIIDRESLSEADKARIPERRTDSFTKLLPDLNFDVKKLDAEAPIPDDATLVIVLGAAAALSDAQQTSIASHLDRGGALLLAYDPTAAPLPVLDKKLGVRALPGHLVDDKNFLNQRGNKADHRILITTKYETHAATGTLVRSATQGSVFLDPSALELASPAKAIVRTMDSAFIDTNESYEFDPNEQRQNWPLVAAIEGSGKKPWRAIVTGDVDLFADAITQAGGGRTSLVMIGRVLVMDALRWLGGEEMLVADAVDEPPPEDKIDRAAVERERSAKQILHALEEVVESKPSERDSRIFDLRAAEAKAPPAKPDKQ